MADPLRTIDDQVGWLETPRAPATRRYGRTPFVSANVRQPAAVSWWIGLDRRQHDRMAAAELPRMLTHTKFAHWVLRVLE